MPTPIYRVDVALKEWATERQAQVIDAINRERSLRGAARALGINARGIHNSLNLVKKKAAIFGYSPAHDMVRTVPEPYIVKGVSTYYNKEGKPAGQWVKSRLDDEKARIAMEAALRAAAEVLPRVKAVPGPGISYADLCTVYTLTDCHVGMKAWARETGADWDLDIAESVLTRAFQHLLESSPQSGSAVVAQLGDWLHQDGLVPVTPTSGHSLDSDSRYSKVVEVSIRILRRVVDAALKRHPRVIVLMAEGNHDMASAVWLRHLFRLLYEDEPRVSVIDSELPYYVHQHGRVMLGWHHGHLKKVDSLPLLFAARFSREWGSSNRRYIHTGHLHHVHEREHSGVTVIQHPTIAAPDSYAARNGWMSERQLTSITYHAEFGQVARSTVTPEMVG